MNRNFIAFSSEAKLSGGRHRRPDSLDAGVRLLLGHRVHLVSTRYTRQMYFMNLPLRANGCGHRLVVQRGPTSTAAMATRGSRAMALGAYWGAAGLTIVDRVTWRGVRARARRCADKERSPARP